MIEQSSEVTFPYARWALISGAITLSVPAVWIVLQLAITDKNISLGIGWLGLIPVLAVVPTGSVVTLIFVVLAIVQRSKRHGKNTPMRR